MRPFLVAFILAMGPLASAQELLLGHTGFDVQDRAVVCRPVQRVLGSGTLSLAAGVATTSIPQFANLQISGNYLTPSSFFWTGAIVARWSQAAPQGQDYTYRIHTKTDASTVSVTIAEVADIPPETGVSTTTWWWWNTYCYVHSTTSPTLIQASVIDALKVPIGPTRTQGKVANGVINVVTWGVNGCSGTPPEPMLFVNVADWRRNGYDAGALATVSTSGVRGVTTTSGTPPNDRHAQNGPGTTGTPVIQPPWHAVFMSANQSLQCRLAVGAWVR